MDGRGRLSKGCLFLGSDEGKEHVECNLDTVDEDQTVFVRDELEVDSMHNWPDLPGSLAGAEKVGLDLGSNGGERISVHQAKIGEEDTHENGAPQDLVNSNLESNILAVSSGNLLVKPVVEIVTRRTVVDETKDRKSNESLPVEWSSSDENLKEIRSTQLCQRWSEH